MNNFKVFCRLRKLEHIYFHPQPLLLNYTKDGVLFLDLIVVPGNLVVPPLWVIIAVTDEFRSFFHRRTKSMRRKAKQ